MGQITAQLQHKFRQKKLKKLGKHSKTEKATDGVTLFAEPCGIRSSRLPSSSSSASSVPSFSSLLAPSLHLSTNISRHHRHNARPSSPPFSSLSSSFLGPSLPRFHFALVLLSLCIISLAIICAFGCYFRILSEQRRARRQRRHQNVCPGDSASNISEKERLNRVNKFIVRPSNGTVVSTSTNCSTNKRVHQPLGPNAYPQRIVPKITITSSGSECDGNVFFVQSSDKENVIESERTSAKNAEEEDSAAEATVSRMRPEEFIRTMLAKAEREQGIG